MSNSGFSFQYQRGIALFLVLGISVILAIMSMSLIFVAQNRSISTTLTLDGIRTRLAARSVVDMFLLKLKHTPYEFRSAYTDANETSDNPKWTEYLEALFTEEMKDEFKANGIEDMGLFVNVREEGVQDNQRYLFLVVTGWAESGQGHKADHEAEYLLRFAGGR